MNAPTPAASGSQPANGDPPTQHSSPPDVGTTADSTAQWATGAGGAEPAEAAYDDEYEPL